MRNQSGPLHGVGGILHGGLCGVTEFARHPNFVWGAVTDLALEQFCREIVARRLVNEDEARKSHEAALAMFDQQSEDD